MNGVPSVTRADATQKPRQYRKRPIGRVIRYRHYDIEDTINYKREMVLLYLPFRSEISDILDSNKFLQLFNDNNDIIMERRHLYESNLIIDKVIVEQAAIMIMPKDDMAP